MNSPALLETDCFADDEMLPIDDETGISEGYASGADGERRRPRQGHVSVPVQENIDPTMLYLQHIGRVSLLTREGEAEVAKRIEDGILPAVMTGSAQASEDAEKDWARPVGQVNAMLFEAFQSHASDIHIEPNATHGLRIRFRIDGVLQEKPELAVPAELAGAFASRIKIMANMNTHETPQPQDGRIQINLPGTHVHLRVNVAPCVTGESIVLRLMQRASSILLDLDAVEGRRRAAGRKGPKDRMEQEDEGFYESVRQGYLELARAHPGRITVIAAVGGEGEVEASITTVLKERCHGLF